MLFSIRDSSLIRFYLGAEINDYTYALLNKSCHTRKKTVWGITMRLKFPVSRWCNWKRVISISFLLFACGGLVTIFAEKMALEPSSKPPAEEQHLKVEQVKGVVDRLEGEKKAVVLVENSNREFIVSLREFPLELEVNMWVDLTIVAGKITDLSMDWETTRSELEKVQLLIEELKVNHTP